MSSFKRNTECFLSTANHVVASGILRRVDPCDVLHGETLGISRVGVLIDQVFDESVILPFPRGGCLKLKDARDKDIVVLWDISNVSLMGSQEMPTAPIEKIDTPIPLHTPIGEEIGYEIEDAIVADPRFAMDLDFQDEMVIDSQADVSKMPDCSTDISFQATEGDVDGEEVDLFISGFKVGRAIVHHVDSNLTCHDVLIGEGNVSVRMLEVEEDHDTDSLPFPHAGADNLGETVGGLVRWAKSNIQKVGCT